MSGNKYLIVVGGPTASGKTAFAIRLARHFKTAIISCDSRQFFREMSIGTARPEEEELKMAPHHFVGHLSIEEDYSVGAFERQAVPRLRSLFEENDTLIAAGGSGLYIKALTEGLDDFPKVPGKIRREIEEWYQEEGLNALQEEIKRIDPDYYRQADIQNPRRLMRALAVYRASGRPASAFRSGDSRSRDFIPIFIQMHLPRALLYEQIDRRVDRMMDLGLLEEARKLHPQKERVALQTVGYQELFSYLEDEIPLEEAIRLIKRNTRRYAKRQITWLRRDGYWKHIKPREFDLALEYIRRVRENGLDIRSLDCTAENLPSPVMPWNDNKPPSFFDACLGLFLQSNIPEAFIGWKKTGNAIRLSQPVVESECFNSEEGRLWLHELACRLEEYGRPTISPHSIEPFLRGFGFNPVRQKAENGPASEFTVLEPFTEAR